MECFINFEFGFVKLAADNRFIHFGLNHFALGLRYFA